MACRPRRARRAPPAPGVHPPARSRGSAARSAGRFPPRVLRAALRTLPDPGKEEGRGGSHRAPRALRRTGLEVVAELHEPQDLMVLRLVEVARGEPRERGDRARAAADVPQVDLVRVAVDAT